ncbi:Dual-action HEIGH metallo-peptidase [Ekhidna lutea]|uniref:Dual-action HEIGH metallo-peptidase n=1 Tax=Ekhidna lutea TaxID=447679 RepID=A0A239EQF8_EKHLU|nr:M57 family metalloprotease [Ekhidna lutea]SNS46990.1 Dual-action HEIGH metallo-peptidase [Ekhidna lutea]
MRRINYLMTLAVLAGFTFVSCSEQEPIADDLSVPADVVAQIAALGFDVQNWVPTKFENGYLVEGDIYLTDQTIAEMGQGNPLASVEQYSTDNLVNAGGGRVITIYAPEESSGGGRGKKGSGGYSPAMIAGLDEAISRYNSENLMISFQRVTSSSGADIVMTRLSKRDERRGVLGSAGFPTASGDPYGEIKMSGVLESSYGLSTDGIATIIAHEMGHCIGFRHTDYFDRSISCGGSTANEGDGGVGANHIPGTPTGATASKKSWMLACTDGGNRPFNNDDKTALDYLY